jgi:hypothetical protein
MINEKELSLLINNLFNICDDSSLDGTEILLALIGCIRILQKQADIDDDEFEDILLDTFRASHAIRLN